MLTCSRRVRVRLSWVPKWEYVEGWTKKFISQNQWRCDHVNDFDDLLQDAYLTFVKIAERYPRVVHPPHFLALYRRALANKFHDMSRARRRLRDAFSDVPAEAALEHLDTPDSYLEAIIAEAPEATKLALRLIATKPDLFREEPAALRENLNMKLRRILGVGEEFDFAGSIRDLLA